LGVDDCFLSNVIPLDIPLVSKKLLAAAAAVVGLVLFPVLGAVPASASPVVPPLVSLNFSPSTVASGENVVGSVNGSATGVAYFAGCIRTTINDYVEEHTLVESSDPTTSQVFGGSGSTQNYSAENMTVQVKYYLNLDCDDVHPRTVPTVVSNVATVLPMLTFDPINLVEGETVASGAPFSLSGVYFDWGAGGNIVVVTDHNCGPQSIDALIDDTPTELPMGLEVTSVATDSGEPALAFAGTVPSGAAGTYRACVSMSDRDGRKAYAWMTFTVSAPPAALAATGSDESASVRFTGLGAGFLAVGLALFVAVRRRRVSRQKS